MTTPSALTKEQLQEEFRAGVTATLRSWSSLRTAVDSGWGGPQSKEKGETLRQSIYDHLDGNSYPPAMDQADLEDALAIYLEEEFSLTLEDDSEKQIAEVLLQMYRDCFAKQDPTFCRQVVASSTQAEQLIAAHPAQIQANEFDDDDDEMEDMDQPSTSSIAQSYAAESLFGGTLPTKQALAPPEPSRQLGEAPPEKMEPELDDDGFAPVATKKNKKKNAPM